MGNHVSIVLEFMKVVITKELKLTHLKKSCEPVVSIRHKNKAFDFYK